MRQRLRLLPLWKGNEMVTVSIMHSYVTGKFGYMVFVNGEPVSFTACTFATREAAAQAAYIETGMR